MPLPRRVVGVGIIAFAALLAWLSFAFATPYLLEHKPNPKNPGFGWYMLYETFPMLFIVVMVALLTGAFRLWRPESARRTSFVAAGVTTFAVIVVGVAVSISQH